MRMDFVEEFSLAVVWGYGFPPIRKRREWMGHGTNAIRVADHLLAERFK